MLTKINGIYLLNKLCTITEELTASNQLLFLGTTASDGRGAILGFENSCYVVPENFIHNKNGFIPSHS